MGFPRIRTVSRYLFIIRLGETDQKPGDAGPAKSAFPLAFISFYGKKNRFSFPNFFHLFVCPLFSLAYRGAQFPRWFHGITALILK